MTPPRSFSGFAIVFAVVFAIAYVVAVQKNYALFTYHPALGEFGAGVEKAREGPAMYWYGWIATSAVAASIAGLAAWLLPASLARRLWSGWAWAVPVGAMIAMCYILRQYFMK